MLVETRKLNKREKVVVSSLDVAETFTYFEEENQREYVREHKAVLRAIRELKCSDTFRGEHFSPSTYTDSRGKEQPCEFMDKDGFTMLVMGFTDPKAIRFKEMYINQFNQMEELLKGKLIEREKGIVVRQAFTKALKESGEGERMHHMAYATYTDLIYRSLFGKSAKQFREEFGITKKDNLRDCFMEEELKQIQNAEMLVSALIGYGWGYGEIKKFITNQSINKIATE
ncbi:MAG: Rha family transcriptional regulator [Lachnospiraceae bacterium]